MKHVVSFMPNGSAQSTLKDSVFDTRFLGSRRIERVSEITFNQEVQKFYIFWLKGPRAGTIESNKDGVPLYFDTYDSAVEFEVASINCLRLIGGNFDA